MVRVISVSIASMVLTSCLSRADWFPALAPNGSFEMDANRDDRPDGWEVAVFNSPAKTAWDRTVAHSGNASVRVDNSKHPENTAWDANSGRWITVDTRKCQGGAEYTLRGWIKTNLSEGSARMVFAWFGRGEWLAETGTEPVSGVTDWTEYTATVTAPPGADGVRVYLMLNGGVGSAWFDDVSAASGRGAPGNFRPIDLRESCNTGFADERPGDGQGGWTDQGPNDARQIPLGRQTWRGIPFEIIDAAGNEGRSCIVLKGRGREGMPMSAEFRVGVECDVLYFLHGCAWAGPDGTLVGRYVVEWVDGRSETLPLRVGREMVDWWNPADTAQCAVGWRGANAENPNVGLTIFPWQNPRPDIQIARVRFESAGGEPVPILVAVTAGDGPPVLDAEPLRLEFTDTTGWYEWAFALEDPTLEEIDMSFLLDPPAGKHGFLTVREDGHFYFEDGTRARFFGTNVVGASIAPEKRLAEVVTERLSRYGVNMLRLHVPDSKWGGLIDYTTGNSRTLSPEALDRYDYFVAQLLKRGIYVYFDLLDYRSFMPGDGVREADQMGTSWEHSIKGASIFDPRMIELQKEFATQLLTHKNPYTGRAYVDEPGLAVQEITNENSLFYLSNTQLMLPSYVEDLRVRWNEWLREKYGSRRGLQEAWSARGGNVALLDEEDPTQGTVRLPLQYLYADLREGSGDPQRTPARLNAMTRFLYELQIAYYDQMIEHLRGLGLKCPITGTNQDFSDAGNLANAYCDFTSRNNYWLHPDVRAKPFQRFRNLAMINSDIVRVGNPVAEIASSSVVGKPMIVPEFNFPFPNEYRAECLPLMAAYGRLQDWDGLLYFAYSPTRPQLENFGNQSDPVRWGQVPMAALVFLRGDVDVARNTVHIGNSRVDCFATRRQRTSDHYSPYRVLPYISRVRNAYFDQAYEGDADVVISSGHSAMGDYRRARRAIVFADWPFTDEAAKERNRGASAEATVPGLRTLAGPESRLDTLIDPATLPKGAEPIVKNGETVGFWSERRCIFPCASVWSADDPAWVHRLYLEAAARWDLPSRAFVGEAGRIFRSDTGQLVLNREAGIFTATAPRVRMAVGFLGAAQDVGLGGVRVECTTPFASITLVSLDGKPIEQSRRLLLTAVARAENTGQAYLDNHSAIPEWGRLPVIAEPVAAKVSIRTQRRLKAFPLTSRGQRGEAAATPVRREAGELTVETGGARSPWILLVGE